MAFVEWWAHPTNGDHMTEHEHEAKQTDNDENHAQQQTAEARQTADETDEKSVEERRAERQAADANRPAQDSPRTAETQHTGEEPHDEVPHPNPTSQQPDKGPSTSINAEEGESDVEAAHRQRQANRDDDQNGGRDQG